MLQTGSDNPEEQGKEEIYPVIKRRQVGKGRHVLKLMNCDRRPNAIRDRFAPKQIQLSEMDKRHLEMMPEELKVYPPEYIYGFGEDLGAAVSGLCVFEYTTIPAKITTKLEVSNEALYLGVFNQNHNQEIIVNICQDAQRQPTPVRILLGKVEQVQRGVSYVKVVRFVKAYYSALAKNSLVFNGGDHVLVIDSEQPQALNLSKLD